MQQLGSGFRSFLLNYVKKNILEKAGENKAIQNIFKYDKVLTPEEFNDLVEKSFKNTGSILEEDMDLRIAFWKEFIEFVKSQKKLCGGNTLKLTFRLLPDGKKKEFSEVATQNIQKFTFYASAKLENFLINKEIDQKKMNGEISDSQAESSKADLKEGKMILVYGKDGKFNYMSDKEIASAIGNVERTAGMLSVLQTEQTPAGETRVFALNPTEEGSSSLQEVQNLVWEKQSTMAEKQLEDNGIYVEAHMSVDANGVAHGNAQDVNGTKLIIEIDLKKPVKPGERVYRITFADDPNKKFLISENELKQKFGDEKKSAYDVLNEKETQAGYVIAKPRGSRVVGAGAPITLPPDRKIRVTSGGGSGTTQLAGEAAGVKPYLPRLKGKGGRAEEERKYKSDSQTDSTPGVMDAKRRFEERLNRGGAQNGKGDLEIKGSDRRSPAEVAANEKRKSKSLIFKVIKYYAATIGGTIGAAGAFSLFT